MTRPLPAIGVLDGFFWTSGQDGKLRLQQCSSCGTLRHTPRVVCAKCRSSDAEIVAVSGHATVVAFTVNAHQWTPALPPPYVVAIVQIDEQHDIRLTTNLVNVEPETARIGLRVRVAFEQHGDTRDADVWLPVFEPNGEPDVEVTVEDDVRPLVRQPVSTKRFEHDVVLSGVGQSRTGRRLMVDPLSLTVEACTKAIEDAGLTFADVDGLATYPGAEGYAIGHSEGGVTAVEEALQLKPTWINGGGETPGQAGSIIAAMLAVSAGLCRHVLVFRTVWESTHAVLGPHPDGSARLDAEWSKYRLPYGAFSAANWIGMYANLYLHKYGVDRTMLGRIATTTRAHAALNPVAIYKDPISMDDYFNARPVSSPFGLYDCDVPCDGAIAVIVSAAATAGDLRQPPVRVNAVGTQILERLSWDQGTLTHEPQTMGPAAHLWTRTDLTPADVDVALLYDGFTFNAVSWLEGLGFCEFGGATDFIGDGSTIALGGRLPLNTHGGQLSAGRTHGFGYIQEAMLQMRGEAGAHQVAGAEVAVATTGGGAPGSAFLLTKW
ncbi:MAG TPA: OB-fold domain-containing protein [Jatrophihabitans sp.]|jgi:acetyl-CoA acetyltransferase/uncharacterized OB-fold protein